MLMMMMNRQLIDMWLLIHICFSLVVGIIKRIKYVEEVYFLSKYKKKVFDELIKLFAFVENYISVVMDQINKLKLKGRLRIYIINKQFKIMGTTDNIISLQYKYLQLISKLITGILLESL